MAKRKVKKASSRRTAVAKTAKRRGKRSSAKGFLPLSGEEHMLSFLAGATVSTISEKTKPLQEKYLGAFGRYSDEAAIAIVSAIGSKYGGKIHKSIPKFAKETYRAAVMSTGNQALSDTIRSSVNGLGGSSQLGTSGVQTI